MHCAGGLCSPSTLPAGTDTFKQMYISDGNHPSIAGTYLEGLIVASSITGQTHRNDTFLVGFIFGVCRANQFRCAS